MENRRIPSRGKRLFDVVAATAGLVAFAPVLAIAAIAIRADDKGPVLFAQERVGQHGVPFRILKLRTMKDQQVTRVGRWLRATGLDEVPQFVNVVRGDMSVVGPRPLTAADLHRLGWHEDTDRASAKPGITGPAQVFAGRGATASRDLEARYAREGGVRLDTELVAISFAMNILGKQRVRRWVAGHRLARPEGASEPVPG